MVTNHGGGGIREERLDYENLEWRLGGFVYARRSLYHIVDMVAQLKKLLDTRQRCSLISAEEEPR